VNPAQQRSVVNVYVRQLHALLEDAGRELGRDEWAHLLDHANRRVEYLRDLGKRVAT
jgi:hypothetical protein